MSLVAPTHRLIDAAGAVYFAGSSADCFVEQGKHPRPATLRFERIGTPTPTPAREVRPLATTPAPCVVALVTADEARAAADIAADVAALAAGGLAPDETYFAPGTEMLEVGVDRYWSLRRPVEACAPVADEARALVARIGSEERRDVVVDADKLGRATFDAGGHLTIPGVSGGVRLNRKSLGDLLSRNSDVFPSAKAWALSMGAEALAAAVTDGFRRGAKADTLKDSTFRTRNHAETGERVVWAVVGPKYPGRLTDADQSIPKIVRALSLENARGEWTYDPMTAAVEFTGTWVKPITVPRVGEIWQGYVKLRTRDDGQGRIWVSAGGRRILCVNCTEAPFDGEALGQIHRGTPEEVIRKAIEEGRGRMAQIRPLLERWGVLADVVGELQIGEETVTGTDALTAMCLAPDMLGRTLKAEGIAIDSYVAATHAAFEVEPGDSVLALLNAVTRSAHEARFLDAAQRWAIERRAGQLVRILADGTNATAQA